MLESTDFRQAQPNTSWGSGASYFAIVSMDQTRRHSLFLSCRNVPSALELLHGLDFRFGDMSSLQPKTARALLSPNTHGGE